MSISVWIDDVTKVTFTTEGHLVSPGGHMIITVEGTNFFRNESVVTEVRLDTFDPIVWDHFRDIEGAMVVAVRPLPAPAEEE